MKKSGTIGRTPTTTVRLPETLHQEIKESAAARGHSMNAEIIHRLTNTVGKKIQNISDQNEKTHEMLQEILNTIKKKR